MLLCLKLRGFNIRKFQAIRNLTSNHLLHFVLQNNILECIHFVDGSKSYHSSIFSGTKKDCSGRFHLGLKDISIIKSD